MTQRDVDADHTPLGRAIKVVEEQLLEMSTTLIALQERVRHGELEALKDSAKLTVEIRHWLKMPWKRSKDVKTAAENNKELLTDTPWTLTPHALRLGAA